MITVIDPTETTLTPRSTMREVLAQFPGAQRALFRRYHIGGCVSCGFQPEETLAQLCQRNGNLDLAEVINHIQTSHEEDLRMQIASRELAEVLRREMPMRLLDIRTREEFDAARINGAILFTEEIMQQMLARWDREELLIIYDHTGKKSMDAAAYFLGHGFKNVRALRGGIDAWSQEVDSNVRRYRFQE
jgi:rhodanese-related sulfurtransferase